MLHSSSKNPNLIFKGCDKGGGLAIINRSYYDGEIHRQLFVTYSYRKNLKGDPTCVYKTNINFFLSRAHEAGYLTDREWGYLTNKQPTTAIINVLPKAQKDYQEFPPGHPIVAINDFLSEHLSNLIDFHIRHLPT